MKKILVILLSIMLCYSFVFADDSNYEEPIYYTDIIENFAFQPTLSRYNAMGQSGLAVAGRLDSLFTNPAAIAGGRFGLSVPSVALTIYNVQKVVADKSQRDLVASLINKTAAENDSAKLAEQLIKNLGNGYNLLATIDASTAVTSGFLGWGNHIQVKLHTFAKGSSNLTNTMIIPEVNFAETWALGFNLIQSESFKLQAGISSHISVKLYLQGQSATTLIKDGKFQDISNLKWTAPLMAGYAIPFDIGVNFNFIDDAIRFCVTANNLNGTYHMASFTSYGDFSNALAEYNKEKTEPVPEGHVTKESKKFELKTPWTLNFGVALAPNTFFNPTISVDFVDVIGMFKDFETSDILLHMNAGIELTVLIFNIRAGINRGYASVGAGFGLLCMRVEASYGWQEFGTEIGDKPVDSFTIRFNLGYDK